MESVKFIRPMLPADISRVHEVYYRAHLDEYAEEVGNFLPRAIDSNPSLQKVFDESQIYVFDDGLIKGFVGHKEERIGWLYVDPDYRGLGVGKQLLDFMLGRMPGGAAINVVKSNRLGLELYQRRGFLIAEEFDFDFQEQSVKALTLILLPLEMRQRQ